MFVSRNPGVSCSALLGICWMTVIWLFLIIGGMIFPGTLAVLMLLHHPRAFEWILSAAMCWIIFDVGKTVIKYPPWKL